MKTRTRKPANKNRPQTIAERLASADVKARIGDILPRTTSVDRFLRTAYRAIEKSPALMKCTPDSVAECIVQACELGLWIAPDGPLSQAYLEPRKNPDTGAMEAVLQIGYRGWEQLARNSGQVARLSAGVVRQGDVFEHDLGTDAFIKHKRAREEGERPITHFYGILRLKGADPECVVWTVEEMQKHRDTYRMDKALVEADKRYRGAWDTHFEAKGRITLIRLLAKRAPLSPELALAAAQDEKRECAQRRHGIFPECVNVENHTLLEINTQLKRVGLAGEAALEFMEQFTEGLPMTEAMAQAMLAKLARMPEVEIPVGE